MSLEPPTAQCRLLGVVPFDDVLALQQRLVYEAGGRRDPTATMLLCEHPPVVTIGRHGSRSQLRIDDAELARRGIEVRFVNRGGGAIVHGPGQLAVYPIVPLGRFGLTVGEYLTRLQSALATTADEIGFAMIPENGRRGLWGRNGQAGFVGVAIRNNVAYFGCYLNVATPQHLLHLASGDLVDPTDDAARGEPTTLAIGQRRPVRMPAVRQIVAERLSTALGCERYHIHTGHPSLPRSTASEDSAHVG